MTIYHVAPGEMAMVTEAFHRENINRLCQIIQAVPDPVGGPEERWWLCEFSRPVMTNMGLMHFACILDCNLLRVGLATSRMRYPRDHYDLCPSLQYATSPREAAA